MILFLIAFFAILIGIFLEFAASKLKVKGDPIVEQIDALLPQTQCGQCGYPGCKPYAEAIANGEDINKCPPGGASTIANIADLLGVEATSPVSSTEKMVAVINESECIGCTKCIQACPVDAIIGANKMMHGVIYDSCTGCNLCLDPCPVDCISMHPQKEIKSWNWHNNSIDINVEDNHDKN